MPQEAAWARTEVAAGDEAKMIVIQGAKNPIFSGLVFAQYTAFWICNLLLFFSAVTILMLGGYARLAVYPFKGSQRDLAILRCVFMSAVIGGIGIWQSMAVYNGLLSICDLINVSDNVVPRNPSIEAVLFALPASLLLPLLFIGSLAILSRKQRVPLATGLGRGLRGAALPVAAALFVLYGVSLLPTAYFGAQIDQDCVRVKQSEPRHFAEIVGKVWPGDPQP